MTHANPTNHSAPHPTGRWRVAYWCAAAAALLAPLLAMQVTDEVDWTGSDFAFAAALLTLVGLALEAGLRRASDWTYRLAWGLAVLSGFLLVWLTGAVGLIGSEANDANALYLGVLAIAMIGALAARFRAADMARAMAVTTAALVLVPIVAWLGSIGDPITDPINVVLVTGFFVAQMLGSALLFHQAARGEAHRTSEHS
jgi:hypothetical protein